MCLCETTGTVSEATEQSELVHKPKLQGVFLKVDIDGVFLFTDRQTSYMLVVPLILTLDWHVAMGLVVFGQQ